MNTTQQKNEEGVREIKVTIEGTSKEIADLVLALQDRHSVIKASPKETMMTSEEFIRHLREKSHDTSEEKSYLSEQPTAE